MAIVLRCPHCDKKIEAPDTLAGRRIKCLSCNQRLRIPIPTQPQTETFTVAPLDQEEERERKRLISDSLLLNQIISEQTAEVPDTDSPQEAADDTFHVPPVTMDAAELHDAIVEYLRSMADGHLEQALPLADSIVSQGPSALSIIDAIALREIPEDTLADIPPQILSGLIRNLRAEFP
ncbi:MAG: hypothetical protein IIA65_05315 [Planctomycetes bacterium]|nr:hypothetical protein [Planctomycetota bacterium]